jgi:hypothetical protein
MKLRPRIMAASRDHFFNFFIIRSSLRLTGCCQAKSTQATSRSLLASPHGISSQVELKNRDQGKGRSSHKEDRGGYGGMEAGKRWSLRQGKGVGNKEYIKVNDERTGLIRDVMAEGEIVMPGGEGGLSQIQAEAFMILGRRRAGGWRLLVVCFLVRLAAGGGCAGPYDGPADEW